MDVKPWFAFTVTFDSFFVFVFFELHNFKIIKKKEEEPILGLNLVLQSFLYKIK